MRKRADGMAGGGAIPGRTAPSERESVDAAALRRRESRAAAKAARIWRERVHAGQRWRLVRQIRRFRAGGRGIRSGRAASPGQEIGRIRKKIIGRSLRVQADAFRGKNGLRGESARGGRAMARGAAADLRLDAGRGIVLKAGLLPAGFGIALALVHEPAGEHGGGVFFEPLVEQGRNFLPEIGGVGEPCEFVALQAVARSREQELPRGLSRVTSQGYLPKRLEKVKIQHQ